MPVIGYTAPKRQSAYAQMVEKEIDLLLVAIEENPESGTELIIPTDDVNKVRVAFAKAANAKGKTARLHVNEPVKGDAKNTRLVFTLTEKHKPRKGTHEDDTTTDEETVIE